MVLTDRFDHALGYASRLHRTQLRKGTAIPYISHLLAVSSLVIEHGGDEDQAIAALLHDAAEDQGGQATLDEIEVTFGSAARDTLSAVTIATHMRPAHTDRHRRERDHSLGLSQN